MGVPHKKKKNHRTQWIDYNAHFKKTHTPKPPAPTGGSRVGISNDLDKNDDLMTPNDAKMT